MSISMHLPAWGMLLSHPGHIPCPPLLLPWDGRVSSSPNSRRRMLNPLTSILPRQ